MLKSNYKLLATIFLCTIVISCVHSYEASSDVPHDRSARHLQSRCLCVECTIWASWGSWQPCTGRHFDLIQHRIRYCPQNPCRACPEQDRLQQQVRKCQVPQEKCSPFNVWTDCSVPCGGTGTRQREAICVTPNADPSNAASVVESKVETAACHMGDCPAPVLVQAAESCLTAKSDPGPFVFNLESGKYRIKLVHVSGGLTCLPDPGQPYWPFGCRKWPFHTWVLISANDNPVGVRGPIIIEVPQFSILDGSGLNVKSVETEEYFEFEKGQTYLVWYKEAQNALNANGHLNNDGTSCVKVLAQEFPHPIKPSRPKPCPRYRPFQRGR